MIVYWFTFDFFSTIFPLWVISMNIVSTSTFSDHRHYRSRFCMFVISWCILRLEMKFFMNTCISLWRDIHRRSSGVLDFFLFVLSASTTTLPFSLSHFIVNIHPLLKKLGSVSLFTKIKVICILKICIYVEYMYIIIYTDFFFLHIGDLRGCKGSTTSLALIMASHRAL